MLGIIITCFLHVFTCFALYCLYSVGVLIRIAFVLCDWHNIDNIGMDNIIMDVITLAYY